MPNTDAAPIGKGANIAFNIVRVLLAIAFLGAAGAKFAGVPMMVQVFDQIGLGQGFRYITAVVEVVGVIGLFVRGYSALAALWLGVTMFFAFLAHLFLLHTNPAGALVLLTLSMTLAWLRRDQIAAWRART